MNGRSQNNEITAKEAGLKVKKMIEIAERKMTAEEKIPTPHGEPK